MRRLTSPLALILLLGACAGPQVLLTPDDTTLVRVEPAPSKDLRRCSIQVGMAGRDVMNQCGPPTAFITFSEGRCAVYENLLDEAERPSPPFLILCMGLPQGSTTIKDPNEFNDISDTNKMWEGEVVEVIGLRSLPERTLSPADGSRLPD